MEAAGAAMFFLFFIGIFVFSFAVAIGGTVLWIWMIVDCATNEPSEGNDKVVWVLILIFTHWVGALIYLLVRRPERKKRYGR